MWIPKGEALIRGLRLFLRPSGNIVLILVTLQYYCNIENYGRIYLVSIIY